MPLVTSKAPDFKAKAVMNGEIVDASLSQIQGGKWFVLFFYPLDFTFVCPTEITAYSDKADKFKEVGANLATTSVNGAFSNLAWVNPPCNQGDLG